VFSSSRKMSNFNKKAVRKTESHKVSSSFRRFSSRATLSVAVVGGAIFMFMAISLGEHLATLAIRENERLAGNDLAASVDHVLYSASAQSRANVEALTGLPCNEVERRLAELETHLRYIRAVALVENGPVYCSSALGSVDVPLSAYLKPQHGIQGITLLPQTPFQSGIPVLAVFSSTTSNRGVLYVIDGDYLADILVHGVRYGAQRAAFAIQGSGLLDDHGPFDSAVVADAAYSTHVTSRAWPFAILAASSPPLYDTEALEFRTGFWCRRLARGRPHCRLIPARVCATSVTAGGGSTWTETQ
jgi:hypothetical protein